MRAAKNIVTSTRDGTRGGASSLGTTMRAKLGYVLMITINMLAEIVDSVKTSRLKSPLDRNQHVQGVPVRGLCSGHEAVVVRVVQRRVQCAVEPEDLRLVVELDLVPAVLRNLDHHLDQPRSVRSGIELREVHAHPSLCQTLKFPCLCDADLRRDPPAESRTSERESEAEPDSGLRLRLTDGLEGTEEVCVLLRLKL